MKPWISRLFGCAAILCSVTVFSGDRVLVIRHVTLHTVSRGVIADGTLMVRSGRIVAAGKGLEIPGDADFLDGENRVVVPGFLDGGTDLGVADIPGFDGDASEPGAVTPHLRVTDAWNPDHRLLPRARSAGTVMVMCMPTESDVLSGQAGLFRLTGESLNEALAVFPAAVAGTLGEAPKRAHGKKGQAPMTRMGTAALLRQTLIDAAAYADRLEGEGSPDRDLKNEALVPVVRGELPLLLGAWRYDDILTALRIAEEFDVRLILSGGTEAHRASDGLRKAGVPVVIGPFQDNALREETMDAVPDLARRLYEAGVPIAFRTGSYRYAGSLLEQARVAVQNGLPEPAALEALTLGAARIFGVESDAGSLDAGKEATFLILDGPVFDSRTHICEVVVRGVRYTQPLN